ncbi:hypothetical protein [uncultured Alistipes sp.]|uniref:hypothetical protein n=1 Tax=uncultured Alistipes sp. TaxID=538949 RepID=UPI0028059F4D|nr:hypothetical protein [uncultured Alistipes sp.]
MQILPKWLRPTLLWTAAVWISGAGTPLFAATATTAASAVTASASAITAAAALSTAAATPLADFLAKPLAEAPDSTVVLRFDEAQREEMAAPEEADLPQGADTSSRVICKVNHRRRSFLEAYDAVTLWNVKRVKVRHRRKRLTDTTRREEVKLLKFFIERNRRKGERPHLEGNVAGYNWDRTNLDGVERLYIDTYTLRRDYDSVRRIGGDLSVFSKPSAMWHKLSPRAIYVLNGQRVDPMTFRFIDGLILRTLNIDDPTLSTSAASVSPLSSVTPPSVTVPSSPASVPSSPASASVPSSPASAAVPSAPLRKEPVVSGTTYPDREPLVFFCDAPSSIKAWLAMGLSGAFQGSAEVEMSYYYMLPVEAVQLFGERGLYGAICIDIVR